MKWLSIFVALGLLFAPLSVSSEPVQSAQSVTLSIAEYDQIVAAIQEADKQLQASSETIKRQDKDLKMLWIFSGALALALIVDGTAEIIRAVK